MRIVSKQFGGFLSTSFTPFSPVDTATPEATTKDTKSKDEEKGSNKSIIEQIFDPKMNMLASDAQVLAKLASSVGKMESSDYFGSLPRAKQWASIYQMYVTKANQARNSYEFLSKAKDHLIKSGAAQEVAITSEGYMFVHKNGDSEISLILPEQFDRSKDIAVTNSELTYLRANNPKYAFNDKMAETLMGASSLKEIREIIKSALDEAKTTKESSEVFVNPFEYAKSKEGLEALKAMNITAEDLRTMDAGTLIKVKTETDSNAEKIVHAINVIKESLTPQQRALLKLRAKEIGGKADENSLILEYAQAALNHKKSISLSTVNTFSSGNAESRSKGNKSKTETTSADLEKQKMPPSVEFLVGYGQIERHRFSDGSRGSLFVDGNQLPILSKTGVGLGITPMYNIQSSQLAGGLDYSNVTVGGELIDELKFNHLLVYSNKAVNAPLPIDQEKLARGIIAPDLEATKRLDQVWKILLAKGITGKTQQEIDIINKTLEQYSLPAIFKGLDGLGNPIVNITNYRRFAVMNGLVDSAALSDEGKFSYSLIPLEGKEAEAALANFKRFDKRYKGNKRGLINSTPDIYRGTVFVPIIDNPINAYAGTGVDLTTGQAELLTRAVKDRQQRSEQPKERKQNNFNIGQY